MCVRVNRELLRIRRPSLTFLLHFHLLRFVDPADSSVQSLLPRRLSRAVDAIGECDSNFLFAGVVKVTIFLFVANGAAISTFKQNWCPICRTPITAK